MTGRSLEYTERWTRVSCAMLTAIVLSPLAGTITGFLVLRLRLHWTDRVRPAMGDYIVARATVVHSGKNQAVCRCDVYVFSSGGESLCATAQGTIARLSQPSESRA
jgi:acyl-coenzyme A thioesterase PaaI-like protein